MTPDFAQFLAQTPESERVGRVFKLTRERGGEPIGAGKVGVMIAKIGSKAGVVVNKADGKFASAHDLRRAFGTRWAKRVMPAVLKRLMRHSAIQTTMGYYVDLDAAEVADQLWASYGNTPAAGNTLGNTEPGEATADTANKTVRDYTIRG
jgi:integrase